MAPIPKKTDEQPLSDIELPGLAPSRQRKPDTNHHCADDDRRAHPDAFGDVAHGDAAAAEAEPGKRGRQSRNRAQAVRFGGDQLERHNGDPRRAERQRQDHQQYSRNDPG